VVCDLVAQGALDLAGEQVWGGAEVAPSVSWKITIRCAARSRAMVAP